MTEQIYIDEHNKKIFLNRDRYIKSWTDIIENQKNDRVIICEFDVQRLPETLINHDAIIEAINNTGAKHIYQVCQRKKGSSMCLMSYHVAHLDIQFYPLDYDTCEVTEYKILR